ncbi:MAG TPA: hypothetical protein VNK67_13190 [Burkholderiales bacterium]|nr:hypothetical protein [Burkholderiales bacterium]
MRKLLIVAACGALALAAAAAAQGPLRVRGVIGAFDGKTLAVSSSDGRSTSVELAEATEIVYARPLALAEIKPGDFLGVTSMRREDGALVALEVRRFPKPLNPGHRPFDGRSDQTMTNATVSAVVTATAGRELTLTYEGGSQRIVVPESASVSTLVPGNRSQLVPGAPVNLTAEAAPGSGLVARRIQVGPPR